MYRYKPRYGMTRANNFARHIGHDSMQGNLTQMTNQGLDQVMGQDAENAKQFASIAFLGGAGGAPGGAAAGIGAMQAPKWGMPAAMPGAGVEGLSDAPAPVGPQIQMPPVGIEGIQDAQIEPDLSNPQGPSKWGQFQQGFNDSVQGVGVARNRLGQLFNPMTYRHHILGQ